MKNRSPIISSDEGSRIIDVEYGVPWPIRTSFRVGSDNRDRDTDEDKSDKDGCSGEAESNTVYNNSEEDDSGTETYLYARDSDCSDDNSSYQDSNTSYPESNTCDDADSDSCWELVGECDNCDERGPLGNFCYTCEDSGFIYG